MDAPQARGLGAVGDNVCLAVVQIDGMPVSMAAKDDRLTLIAS